MRRERSSRRKSLPGSCLERGGAAGAERVGGPEDGVGIDVAGARGRPGELLTMKKFCISGGDREDRLKSFPRILVPMRAARGRLEA